MEWFKCEKCSQQLDKPELFYHFLVCPAKKGNYHVEVQETVAVADDNGSSNQPQWFCSLCNVDVESQHDLLRHGYWKKHWEKVPKQQPSEEAVAKTDDSAENNAVPDDNCVADKENIPSNGDFGEDNSLSESGNLSVAKKRKMDANDGGSTSNCLNQLGNGAATQASVQEMEMEMEMKEVKKAELEPVASDAKREQTSHKAEKEVERNEDDARKESGKERVNWKKLIVSLLKDVPDGALRMSKLRKLVLERLLESGTAVDVSNFNTILENKINSSTKCTVDGKYVRLGA